MRHIDTLATTSPGKAGVEQHRTSPLKIGLKNITNDVYSEEDVSLQFGSQERQSAQRK